MPEGRLPKRVPPATLERLPIYLRILERMAASNIATTSSESLAELAGVNAANVRKDLSFLGSLGTRGAGYEVVGLRDRLSEILGGKADWPVVIAGAGDLGRAVANFLNMSKGPFRLVGLLDVDTSKIGTVVGGAMVRSLDGLDGLAAVEKPKIGIVTTPASAAQDVAMRLRAAGIDGILNFAPVKLILGSRSVVRDVDVGMHLLVLSHLLLPPGHDAPGSG